MPTGNESPKWIPVEEYSFQADMVCSELVSMIVDGELPGERRGNRWFVAAPLVVLVPGGAADGADLLKISACCLGPYLTAGRGELGIPLRICDPGWPAALAAMNAAMKATPAELPVEVWLNGEHLLVDSSLWADFSAALVEFETLVDPSVETER